jgi:hypothetical protein
MEAQRRANTGKPSSITTKKRQYGSDLTASSARGSEDRSSAVPPPPPRGTKRGRDIEGIDKVRLLALCAMREILLADLAAHFQRQRQARMQIHQDLLCCDLLSFSSIRETPLFAICSVRGSYCCPQPNTLQTLVWGGVAPGFKLTDAIRYEENIDR